MKNTFLKKNLCLVLTVVMVLSLTVPALAGPAINGAADAAPDDPPVELFGMINLSKTVVDEGLEFGIGDWMLYKDYDLDIFSDITFEIYNSDITGKNNGKVEGVTGRIENLSSQIIFYNDTTGQPHAFAPGWYLVREVLGVIAADYFKNADDLFIYFNGKAATSYAGPELTADTTFTITQYKEDARPLQALYRDENGIIRYLKNAPALDVDPRPNNGGGALGTSRFTAKQDNGTVFESFCADIGALSVKGKYYVDPGNHGLDDAAVLKLTAALDYIYAMDNELFATPYDRIALSQIVVWNSILAYSDDPMIADLWLRNIAEKLLYKDAWGELFKIEGLNHESGTNNWYIKDYKDLIDDIYANPDKYVGLYEDRIAGGADNFVGGLYFLVGDGSQPAYMQQRQVIMWFGNPVEFENEPKEDTGFYGELNLLKVVLEDGESTGISAWLYLSKGLDDAERDEILGDITFEIYYSNKDGNNLGIVNGVTGTINNFTNVITFNDDVTGLPHGFEQGWYLVHEVMGPKASAIFKDVKDLVIYFNGETAVSNAGPEFNADTTFTITQYKEDTRPLQALYRDENGIIRYLKSAPALDVDPRPNNGGGALGTSRFTAKQDNGTVFESFCADIGALSVKGKYYVDPDNHGLDDAAVLKLTAALDYIYAMDNELFATPYDRIALAQIVVWNSILTYSDEPMIADLWLRNIAEKLLYKDAWGELFKIEGLNHESGTNNWYINDYKDLIDDIFANPDKYVGLYENRVAGETEIIVGGIAFLIGDGNLPAYMQQRQVIVWFDDPVEFENEPKDETAPVYTATVYNSEDEIVYTGIIENGVALDYVFDVESMYLVLIKVDGGGDDPLATLYVFPSEYDEDYFQDDDVAITLIRDGETVTITITPIK